MHAETRCRSVHALGFTTEQKNCGKSGLGHQASRLPGRGGPRTAGRRAVVGRGPRAAGPSGRRAAWPWRAVGLGPLGRGPAFSKTRLIMIEIGWKSFGNRWHADF